MTQHKSGFGAAALDSFLIAAVFMLTFGAWMQHLYTCFTLGKWGFLIAGAIFFPIAIMHGWGIWLRIW